MTQQRKYGCFNRKPFVREYEATGGGSHYRKWISTFGKPDCQFTQGYMGKDDPGCEGCRHKKPTKGKS